MSPRSLLAFASVSVLAASACGNGAPAGSDDAGDNGGADLATLSGGADALGALDGGFAPATHSALPQVITLGGSVLAAPKVKAITYSGDPNAADIDAQLLELTNTSYWATTTSEYGVGPLTISPTVHPAGVAPSTLTDKNLTDLLNLNTSGGAPAWGAPDPSTIYLFVLPSGTIVQDNGDCCTDYDGYHGQTTAGGVAVPYAIVCACPGFDGPGVTDLQQVTVAISHELVEAATDPYVRTDSAYGEADGDHVIWTALQGGEVSDLCDINTGAYLVPSGAKYMVTRSWSNAGALAGKEPCVPTAKVAPYFNSVPVLPDTVTVNGYGSTLGVQIPVGQTKVIDLQLFSEAPTAGPWKVAAYDFSGDYAGGAQLLQLSLDKTSGNNGDALKLTIKVLAVDATLRGAAFVIESTLGAQSTISLGFVGN